MSLKIYLKVQPLSQLQADGQMLLFKEGNDWELFINGVSEDTETINDGVSQTFNNTDDFFLLKEMVQVNI